MECIFFGGGATTKVTKVRNSQQINLVITDSGINGCDRVSRALTS